MTDVTHCSPCPPRVRGHRPLLALTLLASLAGGVTAVEAQEYCVACTAPEALYRCVIANPQPGTAPSLQAACTTALAKQGQHATCAVKRGVTVFECDAPVRRIALGDPSPAAAAGNAPVQATVAPPPPVPAADPKAPPKTLLEAAQRAKAASDKQLDQAGDTLKDAGDATANFLQQSMRCLGSLFTKCGSQPQ
jgi:hypothetical protein